MPGERFWYFAYGWALDRGLMKRSVGPWEEVRRALLKGFSLVFNAYSPSWRGGVANLEEDESGTVYGVVYRLSEEQFKKLDRLVGVPSSFARRRVEVEVEGIGRTSAITYVSTNPRGRWVKPSEQYLSALLRGLKQHGYGDDIIERVRRMAKTP